MASLFRRPISDAVSKLLSQFPFYGALIFDLADIKDIPDIPTALTDGRKIVVGDWFCNLTLDERVFVLAHEALHIVFDHLGRAKIMRDSGFGPDLKTFNFRKWNKATDYIINHLLVHTKVGSMPKEGLLDTNIPWDAKASDVYLSLPDEDEDYGQGEQGGDGFDQHAMPSESAHSAQRLRRALESAKATAKAMGSDLGGLERVIDGFLNPKVPWKDELRDYVMITTGKEDTSWMRPNRRRLALPPHIPYPGTQGYQMGDMVVAVDCSGSISAEELKQFRGEIKFLFEECRPKSLHVVWWDTRAEVIEVDDIEDFLETPPVGGGGTDYDCAIEAIHDSLLEPEIVICLTDGYVHVSKSMPWTHVTVTTGKEMPFGKNIELKLDG